MKLGKTLIVGVFGLAFASSQVFALAAPNAQDTETRTGFVTPSKIANGLSIVLSDTSIDMDGQTELREISGWWDCLVNGDTFVVQTANGPVTYEISGWDCFF